MDLMRVLLISIGCLVIVNAAPQQSAEPIAIISQSSEIEPDGSYKHSFETANGIKAEETGTLKKASGPDSEDSISVEGSYSYKDNEGNDFQVSYKADDEGGFQPVGAHLPTPPPSPPAILRALEWIAAHPEEETKA